MKILLVEDDLFTRRLIKEHLVSEGHTVVEENNVGTALFDLDHEVFDLLITDIILPIDDGTMLIQHARKKGLPMPILAITGGLENAQEDYVKYAELHADQVLQKPISKERLIETLKLMVPKG